MVRVGVEGPYVFQEGSIRFGAGVEMTSPPWVRPVQLLDQDRSCPSRGPSFLEYSRRCWCAPRNGEQPVSTARNLLLRSCGSISSEARAARPRLLRVLETGPSRLCFPRSLLRAD
jgi:hypothetical protein